MQKKHYVLPAFTEPFVSPLSTGSPVAGQGCRLEANSLYVRSWKSGTVGSGQFGTSGTAVFDFATSAQTWTTSSANIRILTSGWSSGSGTPSGCMTATLTTDVGHNRPGSVAFAWTGTWMQLGVPAGNLVTTAQLLSAYDYAPVIFDQEIMGPYQVWDAANTTSIAQLCASRTIFVGDSGWVNRTGTPVAISSTYQPASTTITLRNTFVGDCSDSTTDVLYMDELTYVMGYTPGGSWNTFYMRLDLATSYTAATTSATWTSFNPAYSGSNAKTLLPAPKGGSQDDLPATTYRTAQMLGTVDRSFGCAVFVSHYLAAQSVTPGNYTIGFGAYAYTYSNGGGTMTWRGRAALFHVRAGTVITTIFDVSDVGSSGRADAATEYTCYSTTVAGAGFTMLDNDYLQLEIGTRCNDTGSVSGDYAENHIMTGGTTTISSDGVTTTNAMSFLTLPIAVTVKT